MANVGGPRKVGGGMGARAAGGGEARGRGDEVVRVWCAHSGVECTQLRWA